MPEQSKHQHGEAFRIMTYECKKCGFKELIWNSRDGVTPFCLVCPRCGNWAQEHVDWSKDVYAPHYEPPKGARIFVDLSPKKCKKLGCPLGSPSIKVVE